MLKGFAWARYWPAVLFAVSNIAAVTLVIRANSAYDAPPVSSPLAPVSQPVDETFAPLDAIQASQTGGSHSPLLVDWGTEFDVDETTRDSGGLGLFKGAGQRLTALRFRAAAELRGQERARREADLLRRPLRINYFDPDGGFLGRHSILPPVGYSLPPLSLTGPLQVAAGPNHQASLIGGEGRTLDVQVDPELFRDPQAMTAFITNLTQSMVAAGIQPRVQIARPASTAGTRSGPTLIAASTTLPPAATRTVRVGSVPITVALPKPPPDVVAASAPPVFVRDLGGQTTVEERLDLAPGAPDTAPIALPEPRLPSPAEPAAPQPAEPRTVELPGSSDDSASKAAASKPEPTVSIRIQLSRFPDKAAAERAVARLRASGLGGIMSRDSSSGPDYWVVHTRTFTKRSDAKQALAEVRAMGYEAWQS